MPARTANLFFHGKLSLTPDTFLPFSRASDLHWTFPDLPEHRCYYLSLFCCCSKECSFPVKGSPGRAPKCSVPSPNLWSGKKTLWDNVTCNRGIYYWLQPGPPALTKGVRTKRPLAPVLSGIYWVQSSSWHKWIGYTVARQFLLAQSLWAFSFSLIGPFFFARHMLIGWLQVAW